MFEPTQETDEEREAWEYHQARYGSSKVGGYVLLVGFVLSVIIAFIACSN